MMQGDGTIKIMLGSGIITMMEEGETTIITLGGEQWQRGDNDSRRWNNNKGGDSNVGRCINDNTCQAHKAKL